MVKSQKRKPVPEKPTAIRYRDFREELPPVKAKTELLVKCSICIDSSRCRKMTALSCKHRFHKACLRKWLDENPSCPICRLSTNRHGVKTQTVDEEPFEDLSSIILNSVVRGLSMSVPRLSEEERRNLVPLLVQDIYDFIGHDALAGLI